MAATIMTNDELQKICDNLQKQVILFCSKYIGKTTDDVINNLNTINLQVDKVLDDAEVNKYLDTSATVTDGKKKKSLTTKKPRRSRRN